MPLHFPRLDKRMDAFKMKSLNDRVRDASVNLLNRKDVIMIYTSTPFGYIRQTLHFKGIYGYISVPVSIWYMKAM